MKTIVGILLAFAIHKTNQLSSSNPIIGGSITKISDHPYIVDFNGTCGGSILNNEWILTAAHCDNTGDWVKVGSTILGLGTEHKIKSRVIHPRYDKETIFDYDFQLLQLMTPLEFSDGVKPIEIGTDTDIQPGVIATVTGWGATVEGGDDSGTLQSVQVPIIAQENCMRIDEGKISYVITPRMICAGYDQGGKDSCQGDSGGPMTINGRLIGVVSFGIGCARAQLPGIYARVPSVRRWIKQHTGI